REEREFTKPLHSRAVHVGGLFCWAGLLQLSPRASKPSAPCLPRRRRG
ncbi:unnamed protein product, partial [Ectocarpus sp. 12 AP-2014]